MCQVEPLFFDKHLYSLMIIYYYLQNFNNYSCFLSLRNEHLELNSQTSNIYPDFCCRSMERLLITRNVVYNSQVLFQAGRTKSCLAGLWQSIRPKFIQLMFCFFGERTSLIYSMLDFVTKSTFFALLKEKQMLPFLHLEKYGDLTPVTQAG